MNGKIGLITCLVVTFFFAGYFLSYIGYQTQLVDVVHDEDEISASSNETGQYVLNDEGFYEEVESGEVSGFSWIKGLTAWRVSGMPVWFSVIFVVIAAIIALIVYQLVRHGGDS